MKRFPPFQADVIPEEELQSFQKKGEQGWTYLTQQIFANNSAIEEKYEKMEKQRELDLKRRETKERIQRLSTQKGPNSKEVASAISGAQDIGSLDHTLSGEQSADRKSKGLSLPKGKHYTKDAAGNGRFMLHSRHSSNAASKLDVVNSNLSLKSGGSKRGATIEHDNQRSRSHKPSGKPKNKNSGEMNNEKQAAIAGRGSP